MAHWDGAQGQAKMTKMMQKHHYLWHPPRKTQTQNVHAPVFWIAVFLDSSAEYAFSERLIEFLAFLVQKLGQKTANWQGAFLNTLGGFL